MEKRFSDSYTRQLSLNYSSIKISEGLSKREFLAKSLKAKVLFDQTDAIIFGEEFTKRPSPRLKFLTKKLRPTIDEFEIKSS